ncbi:MAG TPA: hypothetical protein VGH59_02665 [Casimicrobiaceae bacterium]|jgi:hypothetical protein
MKRYQPKTPRVALALLSIAVSAATLATLVVVPSAIERDSTLFVALAEPASLQPLCVQRVDVD